MKAFAAALACSLLSVPAFATTIPAGSLGSAEVDASLFVEPVYQIADVTREFRVEAIVKGPVRDGYFYLTTHADIEFGYATLTLADHRCLLTSFNQSCSFGGTSTPYGYRIAATFGQPFLIDLLAVAPVDQASHFPAVGVTMSLTAREVSGGSALIIDGAPAAADAITDAPEPGAKWLALAGGLGLLIRFLPQRWGEYLSIVYRFNSA